VQIFSRRFVQVGVLVFMTIALALSSQAATFNKASLKGSYSFLTNLWTANVNTNQFAMVGVMTFDGAGNVTASYTEDSGGVVQTGTASGTYTVNSNGTGAIAFTTGSTAPFAITLNSTAAKLAHGVQLLQTSDNANEVISGTAVLQSTTAQTYSVASLKGNLTSQWNIWTADVNFPEFGNVGIITFDGKGNLKGSQTEMQGGVLYTGTFTGTYTVNPDGSGTGSTSGGLQFAFALNSVAAGQAKGGQFLAKQGSGNYVLTGIALKQ
jgi:hypothetical protein